MKKKTIIFTLLIIAIGLIALLLTLNKNAIKIKSIDKIPEGTIQSN